MPVLALRGATTAAIDDAAGITEATQELLRALLARNDLRVSHVISAFFTCTPDLTALYPAHAARAMGWTAVPMLCAADQLVAGALPRCIRVLLHCHAPHDEPPRHVYLHDAVALRDDIDGDR